MYCPKCATSLSNEQKFCRACGLDLQVLSSLLTVASPLTQSGEPESQPSERSQKQQAKRQRQGIITLMFGLVVGCLIPISLGLLSSYEWINQLILVLAGSGGLLLFAGCILLLYADGLRKTQIGGEPFQRTALPQTPSTNQLPPIDYSESDTALTERTTDLLNLAKAKDPRKLY